MAKRAAATSSGSTATVTAQAEPAVKAKVIGRKPNLYTNLILPLIDKTKKPRPFCRVGVYPSKATPKRRLWIDLVDTISPKAPKGGGGSRLPRAGGEKASEGEPQIPPAFLHLKIGDEEKPPIPLTSEQHAGYLKYVEGFLSAPGLHIRAIVPGNRVFQFAHTNVWYLDPDKDPENLKAYAGLHQTLYPHDLGAMAFFVRGKKDFDPVVIRAVREGLLVWQLPVEEETNSIADAIGNEWTKVELNTIERQLMAELTRPLMANDITRSDIQDPRGNYLEQLLADQRYAGVLPISAAGEDKEQITFLSLLQYMVEPEAGAPQKPR